MDWEGGEGRAGPEGHGKTTDHLGGRRGERASEVKRADAATRIALAVKMAR